MGIAKSLASGDIMRATLPTFGNAGKKNCGDAQPLEIKKMAKFTRFFATSLLVLSMSFVAFADGGETQGPGSPVPPPPPGETQGPGAPCATGTSANVTPSDIDVIIAGSEELARWILNAL